jgi:hypothetical protein
MTREDRCANAAHFALGLFRGFAEGNEPLTPKYARQLMESIQARIDGEPDPHAVPVPAPADDPCPDTERNCDTPIPYTLTEKGTHP